MVDPDATVLEIAALMARSRSPLVAVVDEGPAAARRDHPGRAAGPDARHVSATAWAAVAVFAVAYVLIATEKVHRVAAALGGAAVMLLIGATDAEHAFFSEEAGIDWNVIVLLLGMMLIVAVLKRTGAVRVPRDLGGETRPGPTVPGHGDPGAGHRGRVGRCWTTSPPCC